MYILHTLAKLPVNDLDVELWDWEEIETFDLTTVTRPRYHSRDQDIVREQGIIHVTDANINNREHKCHLDKRHIQPSTFPFLTETFEMATRASKLGMTVT